MPNEDLYQRLPIPTIPLDPQDPPRFAQLTETAKDAFQEELTNFFNQNGSYFANRQMEIPTVSKYEQSFNPNDTPTESVVRILLQHPDILEKLPLVAITSGQGVALPLSIGTQIVGATQLPARIKGTINTGGPFALVDGDKISFATTPDGVNQIISTVLFKAQLFVNINQATMAEVIAASAVQLLYVTASSTSYSTPNAPVLRFDAIGPLTSLAKIYPNSITVLGAPYSTPNALTVLGFTPGQTDSASNRPPSNRYQIAANLTVGIDLGAEDENQRRELTDLIMYFFTLEMDKRRKTFLGRSIFDDEFQQAPGQYENYQITLLDRHSLAGEAEIPRQAGSGEQQDLLYINRIQVPITIIDYVDRSLVTPPAYLNQATIKQARNDSDGLPAGDHATFGETSG